MLISTTYTSYVNIIFQFPNMPADFDFRLSFYALLISNLFAFLFLRTSTKFLLIDWFCDTFKNDITFIGLPLNITAAKVVFFSIHHFLFLNALISCIALLRLIPFHARINVNSEKWDSSFKTRIINISFATPNNSEWWMANKIPTSSYLRVSGSHAVVYFIIHRSSAVGSTFLLTHSLLLFCRGQMPCRYTRCSQNGTHKLTSANKPIPSERTSERGGSM